MTGSVMRDMVRAQRDRETKNNRKSTEERRRDLAQPRASRVHEAHDLCHQSDATPPLYVFKHGVDEACDAGRRSCHGVERVPFHGAVVQQANVEHCHVLGLLQAVQH